MILLRERLTEGESRLHEIPPQQLFLAHLAPSLGDTKSRLETDTENSQAENITIMEETRLQEDEIENWISGLENAIRDVENASQLADEVVGDGSIRNEAASIDAETVRNTNETKSRL